jgi:sulfur-carrier protein
MQQYEYARVRAVTHSAIGSNAVVVRVLYFAGLRDTLGLGEESIDLPESIRTVGQLRAHLASRHRPYAERQSHVRVARNEAFAQDDDLLGDGDAIALIPPVAGG